MLIFRSEEHLKKWLSQGNPQGERMTNEQQWKLARIWFAGRHLPAWNPRSASEAQEVLRSVGLEGDFWRL